MAFPPSNLINIEFDSKIVDLDIEYNKCIAQVFELMGLLENTKVPEVIRGLKEIELEYQQKRARYLSEQIEKPFKND